MAKDANLNEEEPRAVSPEELAATEPTTTVTEAAPTKASSRRGVYIGSAIAGGVLAIAIGFGGGYAIGQAQHHGPDFAQQGQFGQGDGGQGGGHGHGDRDGDHGGFGPGQGGQFAPGAPGQSLPGQPGQTQQGQTQPNQSGTGSTGSATTAP